MRTTASELAEEVVALHETVRLYSARIERLETDNATLRADTARDEVVIRTLARRVVELENLTTL